MPARPRTVKPGLHARNRHRRGYDLPRLVAAYPALRPFVIRTPTWEATVDFADPRAVLALNTALLRVDYGVRQWDLPPGFLCPPVPGRADYLHVLADLLARGAGGVIPRGPTVRILDLGVGANLIYPLIGHREYSWSFIGSEIVPEALVHGRRILAANPDLAAVIDLRFQARPLALLEGILGAEETVTAVICNPPFHVSGGQAAAGTRRKLQNLGHGRGGPLVLNFGGQAPELWCAGGELGFIGRLIDESAARPQAARWFTSLVSQDAHLPPLRAALAGHRAQVEVLPMAQGNKRSRLLAWRFPGPVC